MAISTYTDLVTAVTDWLNRDDLTTVVPTFIQLGEADLRRRMKGVHVESGLLTLSAPEVPLPADARMVEQVLLEANGRTYPLTQVDTGALILRRGAVAGRPTHYAVTEDTLWLGPVPDQTYTATVVYEPFLALDATEQPSNWLLAEAPDAYLYAALVQASPYLKDDSRVPLWASMLDRVVQDVRVAQQRRRYGGRLQMPLPSPFRYT